MKSVASYKMLGFAFGGILFLLAMSLIPFHVRLKARQAFPVGQSLAEAENNYSRITKVTRESIQSIAKRNGQVLENTQTSPSDLLALLRNHQSDLSTLQSQFDVMTAQSLAHEECINSKLKEWKTAIEAIESTSARSAEEEKLKVARIAYEMHLSDSKEDLSLVERVLVEGRDIGRLAKCVELNRELADGIGELEGMTAEIATFARNLESTTSSVLSVWK